MIVKVFLVLPPAVADKLVGTSPLQCLEPFAKIVGLYEGFKVLAQLCVSLVVVAIHRLLFQGLMHPFNLPIRPRVIGLRQPVVYPMLSADLIKFQLMFPLGRLLFGKLAAIIRQNSMDAVRRRLDQPPEECAG